MNAFQKKLAAELEAEGFRHTTIGFPIFRLEKRWDGDGENLTSIGEEDGRYSITRIEKNCIAWEANFVGETPHSVILQAALWSGEVK